MKNNMKKIVFYSTFVLSICFMILLLIINSANQKYTSQANLEKITFAGTYQVNDTSEKKCETFDIKYKSGDVIVFRGHFNQDIENGVSLFLYAANILTRVYVDETLIEEFGYDTKLANLPGEQWLRIRPASPILMESDVRIEIEIVDSRLLEKPFVLMFDNIYYGYQSDLSEKMVRKFSFGFASGLICLALGVVFLTVSLLFFVYRFEDNWSKLFLGFIVIFAGIWVILIPEYCSFFIPYPVIVGIFKSFSIQVSSIFFILFVYQNVKKYRLSLILSVLFHVGFLIFQFVMQMVGVFDLIQIIKHFYVFGGFSIANAVVVLIINANITEGKERRKMLWEIVPIMGLITINYILFLFKFNYYYAVACIAIITYGILELTNITKYFYDMMRKIKTNVLLEKEVEINRNKILLSQIQPYYVFNYMNYIEDLCDTDINLAKKAIGSFSTYLKNNLKMLGTKETILFSEELEYVKNCIEIWEMRYNKTVNVIYDLEVVDFYIPTLTIQPIIENALEFGIVDRENGQIIIRTQSRGDEIIISILDNGKGFAEKETDENIMNIQSIKERFRFVCDAEFSIKSVIGVGTTAKIVLKK